LSFELECLRAKMPFVISIFEHGVIEECFSIPIAGPQAELRRGNGGPALVKHIVDSDEIEGKSTCTANDVTEKRRFGGKYMHWRANFDKFRY